MAEDAFRVELLHQWRMQRLKEAIERAREARRIAEEDMAAIWAAQEEYRRTT